MKSKNIILIAIAALLILVIAIGITIYIITVKTNNSEEKTIKVDKKIVMYSFSDAFISNVKDSKRICKAVIEIELENSKIEKLVTAREPEIRNEINLILRSKTEVDLEGSEGQEKLQKQILDSIKRIIQTEKIRNIYFREFVLQ